MYDGVSLDGISFYCERGLFGEMRRIRSEESLLKQTGYKEGDSVTFTTKVLQRTPEKYKCKWKVEKIYPHFILFRSERTGIRKSVRFHELIQKKFIMEVC